MDELFIKYGIHVIEAVSSFALLALISFVWKIPRSLDRIDDHLKKHNEMIEKMMNRQILNEHRIEVHDQLASTLYGTSVSSKMILDGHQEFPQFNLVRKKTREDH